eukprot:scaffold84768_cov60-Phaeocystis_antarctica.AAC.2
MGSASLRIVGSQVRVWRSLTFRYAPASAGRCEVPVKAERGVTLARKLESGTSAVPMTLTSAHVT